jgi:hypothetical protein
MRHAIAKNDAADPIFVGCPDSGIARASQSDAAQDQSQIF